MAQDWSKFIPVSTAPRTEQYVETDPLSPFYQELPFTLSPELERIKKEREAERAKNPAVIKSGPESTPFLPDPSLRKVSVEMQSNPFFTDVDRARLSALTADFNNQLMRQRNESRATSQAIQDFRNTPSGLDFTPMAALADKWSGGGNQLTQAAQSIKGLSQADKEMMLQKMQAQQTGLEGDLSKELLTRLRGLEDNKNNLRLMDMNQKAARQERNIDNQLQQKFVETLDRDVKPALEKAQAGNEIKAALAPDSNGNVSAAAVQAVLSRLVRFQGDVGNITEQERANYLIKDIENQKAKMALYFSSNPGAVTIPAAQVAHLTRAVENAQKAMLDAGEKKLKSHATVYNMRGLDKNWTLGVSTEYLNNLKNTVAGPLQTPTIIDENALDAEIARRGMK